ncbi:MAG: hypothetical protein AB7I30_19600, partial [Isosphaeraceae bacterium]
LCLVEEAGTVIEGSWLGPPGDPEVLDGLSYRDRALLYRRREALPAGPFRLVILDLDGVVGFGNDDLERCSGLADLERLRVTGTGVNDEGLRRLKDLPELRILNLGEPVTGAGFAELKRFPRLVQVTLLRGRVEVADLAALASVGSLRYLTFIETLADASALAALGGLSHLEMLSLHGMDLPTEGLRRLSGLGALTRLDLTRSKLDLRTVDDLRKRLPPGSEIILDEVVPVEEPAP